MRAERTIVLLKQFLGDGVMAEPLVSCLSQNYSHVDVLALPPVQQVLGHLDGRVSFMHMGKIKGLRDTMEQARTIRRKGYDVAFLVNRSFRAAMLARLAKIPVRVGHGTEGRSFLLTQSVDYRMQDFEARSYADLAEAVGIQVARVVPELQVTERERRDALPLAQGATVGLQPGARRDDKRIPTAQLVDLCEDLASMGHRIALFGGPEEVVFGEQLQAKSNGPFVDLIGKTNIRQTMSAMASLRLVVGSDTGLMHLAAGLRVPTVTVFAATPAEKWGHGYAPHQVLQAPREDIAKIDSATLVEAARRALQQA